MLEFVSAYLSIPLKYIQPVGFQCRHIVRWRRCMEEICGHIMHKCTTGSQRLASLIPAYALWIVIDSLILYMVYEPKRYTGPRQSQGEVPELPGSLCVLHFSTWHLGKCQIFSQLPCLPTSCIIRVIPIWNWKRKKQFVSCYLCFKWVIPTHIDYRKVMTKVFYRLIRLLEWDYYSRG